MAPKSGLKSGKRLGKSDHAACWSRPVRPKWMTPEECDATPLSLQVRETRVDDWVPHRPGRVEPRAIKRRSNQPFLTQPRAVLKAQLLAQRERQMAALFA